MKKTISCVVALMCASFGVHATEQNFFNPHIDKEDVVLSMPCDRSMVFRKVYTSNSPEKTKDKKFYAGSVQSSSPFSQNPSVRYVQGAFKDDKGYYFLMAKYELMLGQYETLMDSEKCSKANIKSRLPAVNISYFDAMMAAHNYSLFLQNLKDVISVEGKKAYARLPSDDEWEFAARGGNAVTQSQFEANLPPMDGDISDYAWYQSSQSANGKIQLTGLKKPNPLGLYDMLGNAQEMTLEPFKAIGAGRLLGQSGGISVRGGSFLTPANNLSSAYRTEKQFYLNGKDVKSKDTSTRFVLGLSVANSIKEVEALNKEVLALGDSSPDDNSALAGAAKKLAAQEEVNKKNSDNFKKAKEELEDQNKALNEANSSLEERSKALEKMKGNLQKLNDDLSKNNEELNSQLQELKGKIVEANTQREELRDSSVASNLRLGGFLCKSIQAERTSVLYFSQFVEKAKEQCKKDKDRCANYEKFKSNVATHENSLRILVTYYGDAMANSLANYDIKNFKSQLKNAKDAFGSDNNAYSVYVDTYYKHLSNYQKKSKDLDKNKADWIEQCHSVK